MITCRTRNSFWHGFESWGAAIFDFYNTVYILILKQRPRWRKNIVIVENAICFLELANKNIYKVLIKYSRKLKWIGTNIEIKIFLFFLSDYPYYLVYWGLSNTSVSRIEAPVDDVYRGSITKLSSDFDEFWLDNSDSVASFKSNFTKLVFFWWNILPESLIETNIR